MNTNVIMAEFVIIGILGIYVFSFIFGPTAFGISYPQNPSLMDAVFLGSLAYLLGFIINAVTLQIFSPVRSWVERKFLVENGKDINLNIYRYKLYTSASEQVINRLEYHNSLARISRCVCVESVIFLFLLIIMGLHNNLTIGQKYFAILLVIISFLSFWAYTQRIKWLTRTTILAFRAMYPDL